MDGSVWSMQLKPDGMSAASVKDAARMAVKKDTKEEKWAEVKYYDTNGKMIQEGQAGRGLEERKGCAVARMGEMDGGAFVVWGDSGSGSRSSVRGDGMIVSVSI